MKIVNVIGGIGNQLFQYALYFSLKNRFSDAVKLDVLDFSGYELHQGYELERVFSLNEDYCSEIEKDQIYKKPFLYRWRRNLRFNHRLGFIEKKSERLHAIDIPQKHESLDVYYKGYWQSFNYFDGVEQLLREKLIFPSFTEEKNLALLKKISNKESISIHVRRGDYQSHPTLGELCDIEYYSTAINLIKEEIAMPIFIIFSDDISWCQQNLDVEGAIYVDWNIDGQSYRDMQLMSLCAHNIIANSTFSWWGAWLNANPNKMVIAPDKWMRDVETIDGLIPESWRIVSTEKVTG